ncbi:MAG: hypothetical protein IJF34_11210 [Clostridia bacterium]|nr:hypothetical protein [Clostridia bacterium]
MTKEQFTDLMGNLDDLLIAEAAARRTRRFPWARFGLIAACLALLIVGGCFLIPQTDIPSSSPIVEADMVGIFLHNGRTYIQQDWFLPEGNPIETQVGTIVPSINEHTGATEYTDGTGSVGGRIYSLKGYDPEHILCMPMGDGTISTYLSITPEDLSSPGFFESTFHLSQRAEALLYTPYSSYLADADETYSLPANTPEVAALFNALDQAQVVPANQINLNPAYRSLHQSTLFRLSIRLTGGPRLHLSLYDNGYIGIHMFSDWVLMLSEEELSPLLKLLYGKEGEAVTTGLSPTLEDCLGDISLGKYIPDFIPAGYQFTQAERYFYLDDQTGAIGKTREICLSFQKEADPTHNYTLQITWASEYGQNGWSGPMLQEKELSANTLSDYFETENSDGNPLPYGSRISAGVFFDDASLVLSAHGLTLEEVCNLFESVQ